MKKPELSITFDSSIQFLNEGEFNETIMAQVELFPLDEFTVICQELESCTIQGLVDIDHSLMEYLITRQGGSLGPATNLVLDHCMHEGRIDDFKIYLLCNAVDWAISVKEFDAMKAQGFGPEEGE